MTLKLLFKIEKVKRIYWQKTKNTKEIQKYPQLYWVSLNEVNQVNGSNLKKIATKGTKSKTKWQQ